jgi:hemerythrin-like domain-containing protein
MNIVDALVSHHEQLRDLFRQSENDHPVFEQYIQHLVVHHTMEEKYFYDFLEKIGSARHDALEAVNEHHIIELIIKDAQGFPRDHQNFPIKIEGLGEYTNHHLDEEESEIFPMAAALFNPSDLTTLGELFEEAKARLLSIELPDVPKRIDTSGAAASRNTAMGLGIGSLKA